MSFTYLQLVVLITATWLLGCGRPEGQDGDVNFPPGNSKFLYTKVSPAVQENTVQDLVQRLLPERYHEFTVKVDPSLTGSIYQDAFEIKPNPSGGILVTGTTGVAAAFGFHHYLKYYCYCHTSWEAVQLNLPTPLPAVSLKKVLLDRFRYYQNACTESYSFVWWNWTRWEKEIDWMALNGINLPLASVGQEAIWIKVFYELGLSIEDMKDYITGPAFLAWWRMGNLQKWGSPITQYFVSEKLKLLRQILERMRSFGMLPVLPAFAGAVPLSLKKLYPNSTFTQLQWSSFNSSYNSHILEPTDPLFVDIGRRFITKLTEEVGTDHIYSCDTFNEIRPARNDTEYLRLIANMTYEGMRIADPEAVWMMQAWLFVYDVQYWTPTRVKSYLSGVEVGDLILLDLFAEVIPMYIRFDSFYGHSFIWCMLQNYGGSVVLFGNMELVNIGVPSARNHSLPNTLVGIGMTPEGINQNYVMYDFMSEMTLNHNSVDTKEWVSQYARRRYGNGHDLLKNGWKILESGVYNAFPWVRSNSHTIISGRPGLNRTEQHWYKMADISSVVSNFITAGSELNSTLPLSQLFNHDLVDFTRQFLQHTGELVYVQLLQAYYAQNISSFSQWSNEFLEVLDDLDIILGTSPHFLGGRWVNDAESWGITDLERELLRFNSLNQITLWGPNGEIIDYAAKQWSGVIKQYNKKRWLLFIQELNSSLVTQRPFSSKKFNQLVLQQVEIPFTYSESSLFPIEPQGSSLAEATRIYGKWKSLFHFCLENPYEYEKRKRQRGQQLIRKAKHHRKMSKKLLNKKLAHSYAKSIGIL